MLHVFLIIDINKQFNITLNDTDDVNISLNNFWILVQSRITSSYMPFPVQIEQY
jgi:hypothetical protein